MAKNGNTHDLLQLLEEDEVRRAKLVSSLPKATSTAQPRKSSILAMLILQRDDIDQETISELSVESDSTAAQSASASSVLSSSERPPKRRRAIQKTSTVPEMLFSFEEAKILASDLWTLMKGKKRLSPKALERLSDDLSRLEKAATRLQRKYLEDTGLALAVQSLSSLPGFDLPMRAKYKWVKRAKALSHHWSNIL